MNRHQRRAAAAKLRAAATNVPRGSMQGVVLAGGPMDGWIVAPDAPALQPDWHATLPPRPRSFLSRLAGRPVAPPVGRYVLEPVSQPTRATWQPVGQG